MAWKTTIYENTETSRALIDITKNMVVLPLNS